MRTPFAVGLFASVIAAALFTAPVHSAEWRFETRFDAAARPESFTGRVYLFFDKSPEGQPAREPRLGPNWFLPQPFVAQDVVDWKPGTPLVFDSTARSLLSFPAAASDIDAKSYRMQAVARFNPWERKVGTGAGNGFSAPADGADATTLTIDRLVPERRFEENAWSKLLRVRSERLSAFHGRDVFLQASVLLPASYEKEPERRFPTLISITGFGGTHHEGRRDAPVDEKNPGNVEFLRVYPDPSCPLGHHVFADSANNGPWGTAFVEEFLPALDRSFRTAGTPTSRFLTGHSSGGWSSLWLQITWPSVFGGVWSTAPDPVDFQDFQRIDLYRAGENMYVDRDGAPRPIARRGGQPVLWYRAFDRMETVLGPGGQLHSFEAVFSPRGPSGKPVLVWNRDTGEVDTRAAKEWEKYDIRLILERRWPELGPKLVGKLHVFMGDQDTFYLDGATQRLGDTLKKLGSDAVVEMHPGKDHGSLLTSELTTRIRREMAETYLRRTPGAARE